MADVFLSYKRQDEAAVGRLVKALRGEGLSVWWDRDIPPDAPWEDTIEREHQAARSLVVCWSPAAVTSENVKAEARRAKAQNRLVQTFIAPCEPPMFFGERQGVDLSGWNGRVDDPRFRNVLEAVRAILEGRQPTAGVGLGPAPKRRLPVTAMAAAAVAVIVGGAVAWGAFSRDEPDATTAPTPAPVDPEVQRRTIERTQLAGLEGEWGAQNLCTPEHRWRYAVAWDQPSGLHQVSVTNTDGYRSVAEVVSVRGGVANTRTLISPVRSDIGRSAELSVVQGALTISSPGLDEALRLIRCPAAAG